jgi:hypothetical protein
LGDRVYARKGNGGNRFWGDSEGKGIEEASFGRQGTEEEGIEETGFG